MFVDNFFYKLFLYIFFIIFIFYHSFVGNILYEKLSPEFVMFIYEIFVCNLFFVTHEF